MYGVGAVLIQLAIHEAAKALQRFQTDPAKPGRIGQEAGVALSELELSDFGMANPSKLVGEKGIAIFDEMRCDDSLGSYTKLKNSAIKCCRISRKKALK